MSAVDALPVRRGGSTLLDDPGDEVGRLFWSGEEKDIRSPGCHDAGTWILTSDRDKAALQALLPSMHTTAAHLNESRTAVISSSSASGLSGTQQ